MNRKTPPLTARPALLIEALEPRIAPAGLLNETKFTSVVVGNSVLLDATGGPNQFQGLSTGFGAFSGSYLMYLTAGKALVFTTDLNGNGLLDPGEITGIALGKDSLGRLPDLTLFTDVHGDIVTNLANSKPFDSTLTDSDNNPNNGRDGRLLTDTAIGHITLRTLTAADLDSTVPANTVANRLALTHFSIYGNIFSGGDFNGLTIDDSGAGALAAKFRIDVNPYIYSGSEITINSIQTGTAANNQYYHFTQDAPQVLQGNGTGATELVSINQEGVIRPFAVPAGEHGGDISNVAAAGSGTLFSIGLIATGDGGAGARGGNISNLVMHGDVGSYSVLAGAGGQGATGGTGGSIINFSDLGSTTGQAFIHSGNGGRGTLGAGGDGGTATFGAVNTSADQEVVLGNGGDGFSKGGNGAGLVSTVFNTLDESLPLGSKVVGTWHDIGDIGNLHPIPGDAATGMYRYSPEVLDFDGDGIGDIVYTTTNPDQVVIRFGAGADLFDPSKTVILKVPGGGTPTMTIGDFNGDGRPDIAVASGDLNNFGGIDVFINQIGNPTLNPVNANNFTHNALGDHPFGNAQFSALPPLDNLGYYVEGRAILALASGDFNGDGLTDIAYSERVQVIGIPDPVGQVVGILLGEQATSLNTDAVAVGAHTAATFVNGSLDNGLINGIDATHGTGRPQGTGFFYANPAGINQGSSIQVGNFINDTSPVIMHATSAAVGNVPTIATNGLPSQPEFVLAGLQGSKEIRVYTTLLPNAITHLPTEIGIGPNTDGTLRTIGLGQVDTNRLLSAGTTPQVSVQDAILQDFTITDGDSDGHADYLTLSNIPQTFLKGFRGDGTGNFANASVGVIGSQPANDNEGIFLGDFPNQPNISTAVTTVDPTGSGHFDGFALLDLAVNPNRSQIRESQLTPGPEANDLFNNYTVNPKVTNTYGPFTTTIDRQVNALDAYYTFAPGFNKLTNAPLATNATLFPATSYTLLSPDISDVAQVAVFLSGPDGEDVRYLTQNGVSVFSGNGGNSSNGAGGNAGALGNGTLNIGSDLTTTASIQILFTTTLAYSGEGLLEGGHGGNGFTTGGVGGSIEGVTTRYRTVAETIAGLSETSLVAGNGGNGISGNGGNGGQLSSLSIENGPAFVSGNGGSGLNGGAGGAIQGNQSIFDTSTPLVSLLTGSGGQGSLNGGAGGSIGRWQSQIEGLGGGLAYQTGNGGSGTGGVGGAGGSILNSSPDNVLNFLDGSLSLLTGPGGNGLGGGTGGAIVNFINQPTTQAAVPISLTILTGAGGIGVSGGGGTGGSIQTVRSNATGLLDGIVRVIAGDGGASYGLQGGVGGSLTDVNATATSTPMVAAAGQGGLGLTVGGAGGSVVGSTGGSTSLDSAAQITGKLLVVAGKGGDAYSAQKQDIDLPGDINVDDLAHTLLAFGGVSGLGGKGGDVANIRQPVSTQTSVDIIAGNGGNTPNASTARTPTTGVGQGGSISGIALAGTLGSLRRDTSLGQTTNPPIKSYSVTTDTGATTTAISDFVDALSQGVTLQLDDSIGNVGMVAGAAGTVRGGQPAQDGINGTVAGVSASSILSIVAGSVDRVAPVRQISGIVVTSQDGVLGADKSVNSPFGPNGVLDYYNEQGIDVANLQAGYRLIDGAIFATSIISTPGQPITGPRVKGP